MAGVLLVSCLDNYLLSPSEQDYPVDLRIAGSWLNTGFAQDTIMISDSLDGFSSSALKEISFFTLGGEKMARFTYEFIVQDLSGKIIEPSPVRVYFEFDFKWVDSLAQNPVFQLQLISPEGILENSGLPLTLTWSDSILSLWVIDQLSRDMSQKPYTGNMQLTNVTVNTTYSLQLKTQ